MKKRYPKLPLRRVWKGAVLSLLFTASLPFAALASYSSHAQSILDSLHGIPTPEAQADYLIGKILTNDLYDLGLQVPLLNKLEAIAIEHQLKDKLVTAYTARGYILTLVPDYYKAMYYFRKAYNITLREKGREWEVRKLKTAINIAGIYAEIGDYDKTAEYNARNLVIAEKLKDSMVLADVYQTIALTSINRVQIDSSILFAQKAIALYEHLGITTKKHISETTLAEAYGKSGQLKKTIESNHRLENLISEYSSPPNLEMLATMHGTLAKNYLAIGKPDRAYQTAKSALTLLNANDDKMWDAYRLTIYESLSEAFHQQGLTDSAYHYLRLATELKEALIDEKRIREIAAVESSFLIQEKETTINELAVSNEKKRAAIFKLTAALVLFFLMTAGILWLYSNLSKKKNQLSQLKEQLTQTNHKLKTAIAQRQQYISLIVHDIKSPLFSAYINTQMLNSQNAHRQALNLSPLQKALARIEAAIAKILEIENTSNTESFLNIKPFNLTHMLLETINAFSLTAEAKNIQLAFAPPASTVEVESDYHVLQHVLENVISNAIKYSPHGSVVSVTLNKVKGDTQIAIRNSVSPSPLPNTSPQAASEQHFNTGSWGLGLKLSTALLKEIDGTMSIKNRSAKTKEFIISIPDSLSYKHLKISGGGHSLTASKA
ncbi:sensor histidine kinase [Phaeodactylibacter luteus]|uniref:histidine kinase n=1 Tax=Phaeodactylibacter luteus TaxID=1564516 RepID=A0A5C6RNP9_9BACT|nr:HAMP domain-containing sensor histidine kinase [Phaeodactylibacter luteus]TXB63569.1 HAMP domain-containing histidine kinase [Phaeodactylibacter luteus]